MFTAPGSDQQSSEEYPGCGEAMQVGTPSRKQPKQCGYLPPGNPSFVELAEKADKRLFNAITGNHTHVLSKYLPNLKTTGHNIRPMGRQYELPEKDNLNFMSRILYSAL